MKQVAIFGVGGFGREVMALVRQQLAGNSEPYQLVFVDDHPSVVECNGQRVLTYSEWLVRPAESRHIIIAIANSNTRQHLAERCASDGVQFLRAQANTVVQMDDVQIGEGAVMCPFVTLTSNIRIGRHFHANIYSHVSHDCVIGDYVTFAPGVKCNGNVHIEDHAYLGSGAVIKQGQPGKPLVIGRGAVVGLGAVVTKSVPAGVTVVGNPAKPLFKS